MPAKTRAKPADPKNAAKCAQCGNPFVIGWVGSQKRTTYETTLGTSILCSPKCEQEWVDERAIKAAEASQ